MDSYGKMAFSPHDQPTCVFFARSGCLVAIMAGCKGRTCRYWTISDPKKKWSVVPDDSD